MHNDVRPRTVIHLDLSDHGFVGAEPSLQTRAEIGRGDLVAALDQN